MDGAGGGVMLGMARTVAKGKVLEYEFVQIREGPGADGAVKRSEFPYQRIQQ